MTWGNPPSPKIEVVDYPIAAYAEEDASGCEIKMVETEQARITDFIDDDDDDRQDASHLFTGDNLWGDEGEN